MKGTTAPARGLSAQQRLILCAVFTLPLLLGHLLMVTGLGLTWLEIGWVQFTLALPVYLIGGLLLWPFSSGRAARAHAQYGRADLSGGHRRLCLQRDWVSPSGAALLLF